MNEQNRNNHKNLFDFACEHPFITMFIVGDVCKYTSHAVTSIANYICRTINPEAYMSRTSTTTYNHDGSETVTETVESWEKHKETHKETEEESDDADQEETVEETEENGGETMDA